MEVSPIVSSPSVAESSGVADTLWCTFNGVSRISKANEQVEMLNCAFGLFTPS